MVTSLKTEIKTWLYTWRLPALILVVFGSFVLGAVLGIGSLKNVAAGFQQSQNIISDDERLQHILEEPLFDGEGGVNSIRLNKIKAEEMINSLAPRNAYVFCVQYGFYLLPLIMTAVGGITVCYDSSSNVSRIRTAREGKWRYFVTKQAVMIVLTFISTSISATLYRILSHLIFKYATGLITTDFIVISDLQHYDVGKAVVQALFLAVCLVIFQEFGFGLGYISKSPVVPVAVIGALWFFNITPTGYEPKNAVYTLASGLANFYGVAPSLITTQISTAAAVLVLLFWGVLPFGLLMIFWEKNSSYK